MAQAYACLKQTNKCWSVWHEMTDKEQRGTSFDLRKLARFRIGWSATSGMDATVGGLWEMLKCAMGSDRVAFNQHLAQYWNHLSSVCCIACQNKFELEAVLVSKVFPRYF